MHAFGKQSEIWVYEKVHSELNDATLLIIWSTFHDLRLIAQICFNAINTQVGSNLNFPVVYTVSDMIESVFEWKVRNKTQSKIGRVIYEGAPRPRVDYESNWRLVLFWSWNGKNTGFGMNPMVLSTFEFWKIISEVRKTRG